jgi:hypothetical protein
MYNCTLCVCSLEFCQMSDDSKGAYKMVLLKCVSFKNEIFNQQICNEQCVPINITHYLCSKILTFLSRGVCYNCVPHLADNYTTSPKLTDCTTNVFETLSFRFLACVTNLC